MASDRHRDRKKNGFQERFVRQADERGREQKEEKERNSKGAIEQQNDGENTRESSHRGDRCAERSHSDDRNHRSLQRDIREHQNRDSNRGRIQGERSEIDLDGARRRVSRSVMEHHSRENMDGRRVTHVEGNQADPDSFYYPIPDSGGVRDTNRGRYRGEYGETDPEGARLRGSRLDLDHHSHHDRNRDNFVGRRGVQTDQGPAETDRCPPRMSDVRGEGRQRLSAHDRHFPVITSLDDFNEEPPLPPPPTRHSSASFSVERCLPESMHAGNKVSSKGLRSYSILKEEEEEDAVDRSASVLLPVLEDAERIFHELVASGDVNATRNFLHNNPDFNINCVNYQKISALHVAVKQQNECMVEFLLNQRSLDISDCALYAIKEGTPKIVEMIFDKIREKCPSLEFAGTTHSVDFADDMTPLILAAQLGNYEIIDFLIKRGHSIPPVHPPFCKCEACKDDLKKYDRLKYSTMKLNLYKAICNPMYIFHTRDDPFQRAFELTKELQDAATVFPQFKVSFQELWLNLRIFTVDLIGCCRNAQEVEIILKKSPKCVADHVKFPRLQYAIDLKQKEFVSHPYTQAVLGDAWTGELLEWKIRSPLMQALSVLPRIPMLPIMTIMCIFLPNHSLVRKWKTPVNKMISSMASYLIFLIILFVESNLDKKNQKRGPPNSGLEIIIIIYVVGYIWLNVRICFKQGLKRFFSTMWHWYDTIMLVLFSLTIVFWIASLVDITANNDVDLPRKYWNSMDPELIAEGLFAAAVIMAFFRLNLFLSLNYHLGPLQVSIGKMTMDIFKFIVIFSVIILAWCAGLCRLYQPYEGMVQKDASSGSTTTQVPSFVNFLMTLKTFFWAIFGMSPIESADVIIENLPGDTPDTTIINKHQFTEAIGYIAFALFQFLSVVVVLNMLVACMANTFTKVIDNVTVEWVFGRSQIYLRFMASSVLPPPFNLIPTAAGVKDMFRWFRLLAKPSDGQRARCNMAHCCFIENETEAYVNNEFPSLMSELAQRYIRLKSQKETEQTNQEIDDLRNEMNDIKELLRKLHSSNVLRRTSFSDRRISDELFP